MQNRPGFIVQPSPITKPCSLGTVRSWLACAVIFALAGCDTAHKPCTVSGEVKFNGEPVQDGAIRFVTHDKTPGTGGIGPITDGVYSIDTPRMLSGKYIVMISGFQETGRTLNIDGNEIQEKLQYIPAKYNADATEVIELNPGENIRDFGIGP